MTFRFTFTQLQDLSEVRDLVDYVRLQGLGYPRYDEWVQRTESELIAGNKRAILAVSEGRVVGNLIYQQHKGLSSLLEIKNLRVSAPFKGRNFGSFMLRQLEAEAKESYAGIIGDVRADQPSVLKFMICSGYIPVVKIPLYDANMDDITVMKIFGGSDGLIDFARKTITRRDA